MKIYEPRLLTAIAIGAIFSSTGCAKSSSSSSGSGSNNNTSSTTYNYYTYVVNYFDSTVSAFSMSSNTGALTSISGTNSTGANPSAAVSDPKGKYLYVANQTDGTISGFTINQTTGALTAMTGSPFTGTVYNAGLAMDPAGAYLYVVGISDVASLPITSSTGALGTAVQTSLAYAGSALVVHPNGKYLYVSSMLTQTHPTTFTNFITPYTIGTSGALTAGTAIDTGASDGEAEYMAIDPTGAVLYASNPDSYAIYGFIISSSTGALTAAATTTLVGVSGLAIDSTSKYLYAGASDFGVYGYSINTTTATLTALTSSPFALGTGTTYQQGNIEIDPTNQYIFGAQAYTGTTAYTIYGYSFNSSTGTAKALSPTTFTAGTEPTAITIVKVAQ